jgi:hypothetical protein
VQTVHGNGFTYEAPVGWTIERNDTSTSASSGAVDRLDVSTFTLEKAYRPELFSAVTAELDRAADTLASQLKGKVSESSTIEVDGRKARAYAIDYGGKTEQIVFVLEGKTEYELLCRRATSASTATCDQLNSTFAVR